MQKKILILVVTIVVVAIVAIGGFFVYQYFTTKENNKIIKSIDTCNAIKNITNRSECYVEVLKDVKSSSVCGRIIDQGDVDMCYLKTAPLEKNPALCDKIQDKNFKDQCYASVAGVTSNPSLCDKILDHFIGLDCYKEVGPSKLYLSTCEKKLNQNITKEFLIGKKYSITMAMSGGEGTFNSDGTLTKILYSGGQGGSETPETYSWKIENGNLVVGSQNFVLPTNNPRFYKFNNDVFIIFDSDIGYVVGPSLAKNNQFFEAIYKGEINLCP